MMSRVSFGNKVTFDHPINGKSTTIVTSHPEGKGGSGPLSERMVAHLGKDARLKGIEKLDRVVLGGIVRDNKTLTEIKGAIAAQLAKTTSSS